MAEKLLNGVILQKLQTLDEVLLELGSLGQITLKQLDEDWRTRRAIERDLQVLVEIVIDICQRLLSVLGQTPAATGGEAMATCIKLGILTDFEPYRKMVQFRNFIVHRYERVDPAILVEMVNRRLTDFEQFRAEILTYMRNAEDED